MKRLKTIAVLAMTLCLMIGTISVFAYDHTVSVSAGNGSFEGAGDIVKGGTSAEIDLANSTVTVNGSTYKVKTPYNDDKYFVTGLKLAGYDNKDDKAVFTTKVDVADSSSAVYDQDAELVVAYGLKSNMVEYTVNYISANTGATLLASDTYFGVDGAQPVVSYKYIDGYLPDRYNVTGTISKGGSNTFTFYYYEYVNGVINTVIADGVPVAGGGAAGAGGAGGGAGGAGAAGAGGVAIGDGAVPLAGGEPQNTVNIDEPQTPTTDPEGITDIDDNETPKANWGLIGGGAALVAAIAAAAAILAKRRREAYEDDEE